MIERDKNQQPMIRTGGTVIHTLYDAGHVILFLHSSTMNFSIYSHLADTSKRAYAQTVQLDGMTPEAFWHQIRDGVTIWGEYQQEVLTLIVQFFHLVALGCPNNHCMEIATYLIDKLDPPTPEERICQSCGGTGVADEGGVCMTCGGTGVERTECLEESLIDNQAHSQQLL
jgi:hypothetical protein